MNAFLDQPRYFEDLSVGDSWRSAARTVTETDVVSFAGLTGDFNPLHVDHKYARSTPFGRPIAHGLLGLSLVAGLGSFSPHVQTAAFVRIADWRFTNPIFIGDTMYVETVIVEKHERGRRHGLVVWRRQLVNADSGIVAQEGLFETLVKRQAGQVAA